MFLISKSDTKGTFIRRRISSAFYDVQQRFGIPVFGEVVGGKGRKGKVAGICFGDDRHVVELINYKTSERCHLIKVITLSPQFHPSNIYSKKSSAL
jgi:hypothetical protein